MIGAPLRQVARRSFRFLKAPDHGLGHARSVLVITNIPVPHPTLDVLVKSATEIICSDGGANIYHTHCLKDPASPMPSLIAGDMDSITAEARQFFSQRGVRIVRLDDQDHNDFEKCIEHYLGPQGLQPAEFREATCRLISPNDFARFDHFMWAHQVQPELPPPKVPAGPCWRRLGDLPRGGPDSDDPSPGWGLRSAGQ